MDTISYGLVKDFTCEPCRFITAQRDIFEEHMNNVHSHMEPNLCLETTDFYQISYVTKIEFRHQDSFSEPVQVSLTKLKEFTCDACDFKTVCKQDFEQHQKDVHKFTCQQCGRTLARKDYLKRHVDEFHNQVRPFPCGRCKYKAKNKSTLDKHFKNTHDKIKEFACGQCSYRNGRCSLFEYVRSK